ncbi:MAG TPA: hypothetical protein VFO07_15530, partial [Roseiflexaceae bacterium]|nr:hypothetical protein [Roseiflexaceae bacterium]
EQNGGLPVFGFPTTPQRPEQVEASTFQVQHFERHRLELHPENARPYDVLLGRLGADQLQEMRVASLPQEQLSGCLYFEQTKHTACGSFARAWQSNGLEFDGRPGKSFEESLALFGMPLTNEMYVPLEDGKRHVVQYFERARFEQHPDNAPPYNVLFGLLDNEARAGTLLPRPQQLLPAPLFFNYKSQIVRLERDGLSPAAIVHEDDASEITSFSVSPNGYQLVYVLKSADGYRLIRTSAAGAHRTELYLSPGPISTPRWSPNGVQIAFHAGELDVSEPGAMYQILTVSDGNIEDRMLPDENQSAPALAYLPEAWSPDRPRLLVSAVAKQSEGCTSMIFDLDGRLKALPAPEGQRWACGGAWLPDGRLLVSAVPDGSLFSKAGLWAIDLNTSHVAQFTPARDGDVNVLFGPLQTRADGTSSAFLLETVALPQLGDPRPFRYAAHMLTREGSPQRWLGNVAFELSEIAGWAPDGSGFLLRGSFGEPINRIKSVWVPLDGGAPFEINNAGYILDWGR